MSERESVPWFWQREDLYRWNGRCCYSGFCDEYNDQCNPEQCLLWDAFFDGEVSADEAMEERE